MANKRLFTSFAIEDVHFRDFLRGQARNANSPFEFVDMSVKQPWSTQWKTNCRRKIKGCHGVIALVSRNTPKASGQLWEVKCAREEGVPIRGIYVSSDNRPVRLPAEFSGVRVVNWTWKNLANFINSL